MKSILFFHQSAELYGSDKTLLFLINSLNQLGDYEITIVLPCEGELSKLLLSYKVNVVYCDVIKLSRSLFTSINFLLLPFNVIKSYFSLRRAFKGKTFDVVHSNTLAVLMGAVYAKFQNIKHVWHVHEIIQKPKLVSYIYSKLLEYFSNSIVVNSEATKKNLLKTNDKLADKMRVILNGLSREASTLTEPGMQRVRSTIFGFNDAENDSSAIYIGLVGRINKWKGQGLLLSAFEKISDKYPNVKLVYIGSTSTGQEHLHSDLVQMIESTVGQDVCKIVPFQDDIWQVYDSLDIVVVPSTEPEPFGLVAVEAMLSQKPVVAANHGGLVEIVLEKETGLLFEPNNENDLFSCLEVLVESSNLRESYGLGGKVRAEKTFSLEAHVQKFNQLYRLI